MPVLLTMGESDRDLYKRAQRKDTQAVASLLERHLPGLRAFVHLRAGAFVRRQEEVSDICQSACREVLCDVDHHEWEDETHFKRWLYMEAMRKILGRNRYWRAGKRDPARLAPAAGAEGESGVDVQGLYESVLSPSRLLVQKEEFERLEAAFEELPEDYREVIVQFRLLGMSHAEIAEQMGRSENAVRLLLSRALARLATLVGPS